VSPFPGGLARPSRDVDHKVNYYYFPTRTVIVHEARYTTAANGIDLYRLSDISCRIK
jgi:hypothetical protein